MSRRKPLAQRYPFDADMELWKSQRDQEVASGGQVFYNVPNV